MCTFHVGARMSHCVVVVTKLLTKRSRIAFCNVIQSASGNDFVGFVLVLVCFGVWFVLVFDCEAHTKKRRERLKKGFPFP